MDKTTDIVFRTKLIILQEYQKLLDNFINFLQREKDRGLSLESLTQNPVSTGSTITTVIENLQAKIEVSFNWKYSSSNFIAKLKLDFSDDKDNKMYKLFDDTSPHIISFERRSTSAERALFNIQDDIQSCISMIKSNY